MLVNVGAQVNGVDSNGRTPIATVCMDATEFVDYLLSLTGGDKPRLDHRDYGLYRLGMRSRQ